ncbi:MAG: acyl-CoA-binding protein [Planctomycetes bacterium]|nr:acyl-CoA-binding protein [Planctomycetota bacterium]
MWKAWAAVGGMGREEARARQLAEPPVRRRLADIVRTARARDAEAAGRLERALAN